jgi:hypothetical protein
MQTGEGVRCLWTGQYEASIEGMIMYDVVEAWWMDGL